MTLRFRSSGPALAALLLAGCALGPSYRRPEMALPDTWRTEVRHAASLANLPWWDFYRDPVLTNLIATALQHNHDLRIATAHIDDALAAYRVQRAALSPDLSASATWTRARVGDLPPASGLTSGQFDVFGLLSYELDVWGRARRLTESARARFFAQDEVRKTVHLGLVSGVATTYFQLRALDRQLEIARATWTSRTNLLALTRLRFNEDHGLGYGIVSELDVRQAETQVHAARAAVASLERTIALTENALALLLGRPPGPIPRGQTLAAQWQPRDIPAGLPSELLLRRPDLRAAEQELVAANANIGAARAACFPSLSLTAALGVQSVQLEDLFSTGTSRAWRFVPQLAAPIFNAGRLRAGVQSARARQQAALAAYEQAIYTAFREVDDALVSVAKLREQLDAEEAHVEAEQRRLALSRLRYDEGISSFSDVLDAERFLFNAQLTAVQTRSDLLAAVAQLYKALGGGWTLAPP